MPPDLVGRHGIMSLVEWSGDAEEGRAVLAKIRHELEPAASDLSVVPFLVMQTITDELFAHGLRTYIKAGFAADLTDGLIDALIGRAALLRSPVEPGGTAGAGRRDRPRRGGRDRVPVRQPRWLINIPATWRDAADDEARPPGRARPTPRSGRT